MSKYKMILLRIQSAEGTKRLEVNLSDTTCELFEKVHALFGLNSFGFALYQERNHKGEIRSSRSRTLGSLGLKHGDMLYLAPVNGTVLFPQEQKAKNVTYTSESGASESTVLCPPGGSVGGGPIPEDEVDIQLWKHDGKIQRRRDDKLCRHNSNGCCVHCSPLEPFDEAYLREQNIKHLSFHAYLRKQTSGADRGKFLSLENVSCRIRAGCKDHPPWPRGICSKCQPNAITLNRQPYRHVDNVAFENPQLVERFLDYWRVTGHQRVGLLYGRYGQHTDVPLGIRATVAAIYEPPQEGARDSLRLLPDEREPLVEALAKELGLRRVGWIFTDLVAEDVQLGTVKTVRGGSDSYFLSAQECIMAGHYQSQHPNPCRYASGSSGHFGSKFVTVCVTGDSSNQVHMEGYQVSNQCVALVRDGCLLPTKDAPELGYVRESTDKQYVPDVYYKEKDTYGNEVPRLARPLPVEYLLVDVPASTPLTPVFTFNTDPSKRPFPVENRLVDGHVQDFNALAMYMAQFPPSDFLTAVSDFHLLLYIATMDMLPMREHMSPLLAAVRAGDVAAAREWATSDHWATVEQLIAASGGGRMSPPPPVSSRPATGSSTASAVTPGHHQQRESASVASSTGSSWTCPFCTFLNSSDVTVCDMCRLPRSMTH